MEAAVTNTLIDILRKERTWAGEIITSKADVLMAISV